ncbi:MAG: LPS assembly lipoprotein LptE, partial [Pseudomonadota bacterium]
MLWGKSGLQAAVRMAAVVAMAAALAGCFRPLYAEPPPGAGPGVRELLSGVEVLPLNIPQGRREARVGQEIRNALMFSLYGAAVGGPTTHKLEMKITVSRVSVIVDPTTGRADNENYAIDAAYALRDAVTNKIVVTGNTSARASYDVPGQEQRFARARAFRDAEDRAAKVIAGHINERLASYFAS